MNHGYSELKNTVSEIINSLDEFNSRLDTREEKINKCRKCDIYLIGVEGGEKRQDGAEAMSNEITAKQSPQTRYQPAKGLGEPKTG